MNEIIENLQSPWGIGLITAFPILFVLVGLVVSRRQRAGRSTTAPRTMRYLVLPTAFVHMFMLWVVKVPTEHISTKITGTVLSIFVMSFLVHAINYLFFSEHNIITGKESIPKLGRDVIHFVLTMLITACVLSTIWGLNLGNLLTALGVSSLVLGLALQEPLGNLFNGISLLMAHPFQKGDWVQIDDEYGKVVEFNWRSVKIVNRGNEMIILPNNMIGKARLKNLSRPSRIHAEYMDIGFSYDDRPQDVKDALLELAQKTEGVLSEPPPEPVTSSYDDSSISYKLKFYIRDYQDVVVVKDRLMTAIYDMSDRLDFTIPFPIREVHISTDNDFKAENNGQDIRRLGSQR